MIFLALFLPSSCALLVGKVNSPYPRYMHGLQRRQTPAAASSSWQNVECERSWSNRLGVTLTPITTGVWAAERPFYWNGIDVGGRMVVCRMRDGSLLVHSPVNLTDDLRTALEEGLGGGVGHIVSPNFEHLKYAEQWARAFPKAELHACPGLSLRMPDTFPPHSDLFFPAPAKAAAATATAGVATTETEPRRKGDGEKGARTKRSPLSTSSSAASSSLASQQHQRRLPSEVECVWFDCEVNPFTKSKPFFSEVVFFHAPSRTLFCSDVWWNYPATETPNYSSASEIGSSAGGGGGGGGAAAAGAAAEGVVPTGGVHACSKVPITARMLPAVPVPIGTKLWKFGMDRVYLPFYKRFMVGGSFSTAPSSSSSSSSSPSSARRERFEECVAQLLAWEPEAMVPCHGDVLRGKELCRAELERHFLGR